jgi:lipoprotein-releasing system ATP-binding protein
MTSSIEAVGVSKSYRDAGRVVEVLRGIDLVVEKAELVAIVGPSGSGKSTLLHLLGALDRPDAGQVTLEGVRLDSLDANRLADLRNRSLGFVFQFHQLLPDFTAVENVMMPGRIAGRPAAALRRKAGELLDEVGLADRYDHFPSQLSGGERQRVALCRALLLEPPILLADEPTGNLDPASGEQVLERLLDLRARHGTTTVLVTHNPRIAARCGRALRLEGGVLVPAPVG